jgi:cytochrome c oxidase assembly protein subunit 15
MNDTAVAKSNNRLRWLCYIALGWSILVLQAGGFTTSIRAGMAFLDWPLSNGSINPPGWLTEIDKFAEHSHRLAASGLGLLCIVIALAHCKWEKRPLIRRASYGLVALVILQGIFGGLRVLLDQLNLGGDENFKAVFFAVVHAVNAQITIAILAIIALSHTQLWRSKKSPSTSFEIISGRVAVGVILSIILIGAVMRQNHLTTWVTTGSAAELFYPAGEGFAWWANFLHRGGAILGALAILIFSFSGSRPLVRWLPLCLLILFQITLGILSIQLPLNPHVRTIHLVVGAALFSTLCAHVALVHRANKL